MKLVVTNSVGTDEITKTITVTEGSGNNNPCNLPECYVESTSTVTYGITTTITYGYTLVNGTKMISSITLRGSVFVQTKEVMSSKVLSNK